MTPVMTQRETMGRWMPRRMTQSNGDSERAGAKDALEEGGEGEEDEDEDDDDFNDKDEDGEEGWVDAGDDEFERAEQEALALRAALASHVATSLPSWAEGSEGKQQQVYERNLLQTAQCGAMQKREEEKKKLKDCFSINNKRASSPAQDFSDRNEPNR